ncbi:MAG: efflux RND transporter periplasmic adaptor subunit [Deltaproteobacteria bacterium]|nr:MAG: efflux RND transporter periplasmic adaptor subunit [Deltaproteobacteria bacterium]
MPARTATAVPFASDRGRDYKAPVARSPRQVGREVLLRLVLALAVFGCQSAPDTSIEPTRPHVYVAEVRAVSASPLPVHLVPLEASRRSEVAPRIGGTIRDVLVEEEDRVRKGDLLVQLDATDARGGVLAARGSEAQLRARIADTERELARTRDLAGRGMESARQVERLETELSTLRAQLREVRGNLLRARDKSAATVLSAPFDGVVTRVDAEVGEYAAPGTPLVTVSVLDPLALEFTLTEDEVAHHERGGLSFEVRVGDRSVPAKLAWISSEADPGTSAFPVRLEVPNADGALRAGRSARVAVRAADLPPEPAVPPTALRYRGDRPYVLVVDGDVVHAVPVEVGEERGDLVTVRGQLPVGTKVVAAGPTNLADGDAVVVAESHASPETSAPATVQADGAPEGVPQGPKGTNTAP